MQKTALNTYGTLNLHVEVRDTTETVGQTRLGGTQPVVIRNTDSINILEVLVGFSENQSIQTFRTRFFHTFKTELEVNRQFETESLVGFNNVDPTEDRTLIVRRTTTN